MPRRTPEARKVFVDLAVGLGQGIPAERLVVDLFRGPWGDSRVEEDVESGIGLSAIVSHRDDELYAIKTLSKASPSWVAYLTDSGGGRSVLDPYVPPAQLASDRFEDNAEVSQRFGFEVVDLQPAGPSLDFGFTEDVAETFRRWNKLASPEGDGVAEMVARTDAFIRMTRPEVLIRFGEGDGHHGTKAHGHHIGSGQIAHLASATASLSFPGMPDPHRSGVELVFTPRGQRSDIVVKSDGGERREALGIYDNQFTPEEAEEFAQMPEGFQVVGGSVDRARQTLRAMGVEILEGH